MKFVKRLLFILILLLANIVFLQKNTINIELNNVLPTKNNPNLKIQN
jgi:hypothetical protein